MKQIIVNRIVNKLKRFEESLIKNKLLLEIERSIQLNSYTCGIYSAFAVLKYHKKVKNIAEIKFDEPVVKREGLDTTPLLNIIHKFGLEAEINEKATLADIKKAINDGNPLLISIYNGEHWVVVYGYSRDRIFILDSSIASSVRCGIKVNKFLKLWDENWIAVIKDKRTKSAVPVGDELAA